MKIPNRIKEAIKKTSLYSCKATKYSNIVRDWLEEQGIVDYNFEPAKKEYFHIPDAFIDCCEMGYIDGYEAFVKELERVEIQCKEEF